MAETRFEYTPPKTKEVKPKHPPGPVDVVVIDDSPAQNAQAPVEDVIHSALKMHPSQLAFLLVSRCYQVSQQPRPLWISMLVKTFCPITFKCLIRDCRLFFVHVSEPLKLPGSQDLVCPQCFARMVLTELELSIQMSKPLPPSDTLDAVVSVLSNLSDGLRKFLSATPTPEREEKPNVAPTTDSINLAG